MSTCSGEEFGSCQQEERITQGGRRGLSYSDLQQLLSIKIAGEREWGGSGGGRRDGCSCMERGFLLELNAEGGVDVAGTPDAACRGASRQLCGKGKG